jgi:hypothetical protein
MQGHPKTNYKKAFRGGMHGSGVTQIEDLELTAGSGFLSDKIINAQSAGCTLACQFVIRGTFRG